MIVKVVGSGPRQFFRDRFNVLDLVVVFSSLLELAFFQDVGAMSAFRAFRFFRFLQVAREGSNLRLLLDSIAHTILTIGTFTVLLGLFIYVYSLMGMQFFAGRLRFDKQGGNFNPQGEYIPRANFDSLLWASVTIF